jgi:hypothetical protein
MPFKKIDEESLDAIINVRATSSEKAKLKKEAELAGISMSALARRRYFGKPVRAKTDERMIHELMRLGGLLKHIHNQSGGAYSQQTAEAIYALKACIGRIVRGGKED